MRNPLLFLFIFGIFSVAAPTVRAQASEQKLTTVPFVDLNRYAGRWYEIARYPNKFEKDCVRNVRAEYALKSNGRIKVTNSCITKKGNQKEVQGEAKVDDKQTKAKLKVRFAPSYLSWLPAVWGEYWIVDLDPDYRFALVGDSGRDYFWILSREPEMSEGLYADLLKRAEAKGFDPAKVERIEQSW